MRLGRGREREGGRGSSHGLCQEVSRLGGGKREREGVVTLDDRKHR